MQAPVQARFRSPFHPEPAGEAAFVAVHAFRSNTRGRGKTSKWPCHDDSDHALDTIARSECCLAARRSWGADADTGPGAALLQLPPRTNRRRHICRSPTVCARTHAAPAARQSDPRRESSSRRPCAVVLPSYRLLLRRSGNRARDRAGAGARADGRRRSSFHAHATALSSHISHRPLTGSRS